MNALTQADALFKPVEGGYVFREPYRIGWGKARHYLVTDAQKVELAAAITGPHPLRTVIGLACGTVAAIAVAALAVFALSPHANPQGSDTALMMLLSGVLIIAGYLVWRAHKIRTIAPLLADLTPTDLQITSREMRARMLAKVPTGLMWFCVVVYVLLAATNAGDMIYNLSIGRNITSALPKMIVIIIFTALTVWYGRELLARARSARAK
jgi:hypothetical protein